MLVRALSCSNALSLSTAEYLGVASARYADVMRLAVTSTRRSARTSRTRRIEEVGRFVRLDRPDPLVDAGGVAGADGAFAEDADPVTRDGVVVDLGCVQPVWPMSTGEVAITVRTGTPCWVR